jgi:hypothetical protein
MTDVMAGEQDWRLKAELDPAVGAGGVGGMEGTGMSGALDHLLGRLRGGHRGGSGGGSSDRLGGCRCVRRSSSRKTSVDQPRGYDPLASLPGGGGDLVEVAVVVEHGQAACLGGGGDQ